jgi:hypothetical protein
MVSYTVGYSSLLLVETEAFTERVRELLDEETYRVFQGVLVRNPETGVVMAGCGGLRKARVEEPRRGKKKRGGCRVIYLHIPEAARIDLLAIYDKEMQDDLTPEQRKRLKSLAEHARREALSRKTTKKDT